MENTDVYVNVCWVQIRWNSYVIDMVWLQESQSHQGSGWGKIIREKMLSNIKKGWSNRNYIQPQENEKEQREKKQRVEFREAGKKKKLIFFFLSARPFHKQPVCRCYNIQKVPVANDLEQLEYGCRSSPWSGQVGERQI